MPHAQGTYLGSIRDLASLQGRCYIDDASGCWHLRTARGRAMSGNTRHVVWLYGVGAISAPRAAWLLCGKALQPGQVVARTCDSHDCVNPKHLAIGTRQLIADQQRKRGTSRTVRKRATARVASMGRAKLTHELAQWARESPQPISAVAHALDVAPSRIGLIRQGKAWPTMMTGLHAWPSR